MISVRDIIQSFPVIKFEGNENDIITDIIKLDASNKRKDVLCWCNSKNVELLLNVDSGTIIIPETGLAFASKTGCNYIVVENPRNFFNAVLLKYFHRSLGGPHISEKASIHSSVKRGSDLLIEAGVVIHENCVIGNNAKILNNTIIYPNTVIEDNVTIGANNVLGFYGFGYEKDEAGNYVLMPHIGNLIIRSHVEIGNNNCIDRSVLGSTIIGSHSKIHNFVQVAHGVQIGSNCLITANVTISGGTNIGNNVWIGPGVTIINKLTIGNEAHLSVGSVIFTDVPENATVVGNPARIMKK
jgi:UDP-3-O-[3-hydroxymyristoyl] glucosamine N-acyltransferase